MSSSMKPDKLALENTRVHVQKRKSKENQGPQQNDGPMERVSKLVSQRSGRIPPFRKKKRKRKD